jgi:diaminopimelate decarboxylase
MNTLSMDKLTHLLNEKTPPTPFYAYDRDVVQNRYAQLKSALPSTFEILYSTKANPNSEILALLQKSGSGADVSSLGELDRVLKAGFSPQQISFVGPGKSDEELAKSLNSDILCTVVESLQELDRLEVLSAQVGSSARVCVRVHPDRYFAYNGAERSGIASSFGIDEEQLDDAITKFVASNSRLQLIGLHFYLHSQFLDARLIAANFRNFSGIAQRFQRNLGKPLALINFGGGFGIPYFSGQNELDLSALRSELEALIRSDEFSDLRQCRFFVESGRYIVGPAGVFCTRVLYRKRSQGKTILVCDGGFTQNLAATGMGQLVRRNFSMQAIRHDPSGKFTLLSPEAPTETVTVVGPSCYSMDVLAQDILLPSLDHGDFLCVLQSGAYGPTFSPQAFLTRPSASEIFL